MGEKDIFGRDMAELRQTKALKAAAEELADIKDILSDEADERDAREHEQDAEKWKYREKVSKTACASFRKAVEIDPAFKVKLAEAVIAEIDEAKVLGSIAKLQKASDIERNGAKTGDQINFDGHFLGSADGNPFREAENQFWGYSKLLEDFKYYCVTRQLYSPHVYTIMDKVEYQREDLGEFLRLASRHQLSPIMKGKCSLLLSAWDNRSKEKIAELERIRAALPQIKSKFRRGQFIKYGIGAGLVVSGILYGAFRATHPSDPLRARIECLAKKRYEGVMSAHDARKYDNNFVTNFQKLSEKYGCR